ncbi:O-glycosyl hydrolase [Actinoalloteichus hoggarensis]|uniref:Uncharacterized protein n=1 Tax=Actinoalloteichus hoggarensis TaxID=1470176 RepID=A0A221W8J5_9PSEU|nr:glycoside hydrolase [Actinoalloteichus hoggarensis]ASO22033.1 hypothetical protein AHOG_22090 [Actinoalloteichus hoggarensis]MBB5923886.1 O-glycosyl hydrolase [Actinoalloteichus hoggarensis]
MRRSHRHRLVAGLGVVAMAAGAASAGAGPAVAEEPTSAVTITPDPSYQGQEFEGWGTSLVWFANATGDYPDEIREELAELVFGADGLRLNIARYNIGGGNAPDVPDYLRAGAAVQGWWQAPEGTTRDDVDWWSADEPAHWNPDADRTQRWWIDRIKGQVDHWEAFSNSPPWFMTESGYVSGGFDAREEQLKADDVEDFAAYLVGAVERLETAHGIRFDTLDPFNEPNTDYWSTTLGPDGDPIGGRQEGAHVGPGRQQEVIAAVDRRLAESDVDTVIAAMDETNPTTFAANWNAYSPAARAAVGQLNVHSYGTGGRTTVRDLAKGADKPLWMSEVEGDWGDGQDFEDIRPGLGLARHIIGDLRDLEPSAWVFWQPVEDYDNMKPGGESDKGGNWGSIQLPFDCTAEDTLRTCPIRMNTKFDTARNFTHHIRPGDRLVQVAEPSSVAAIAADGEGATIVHVNDAAEARTITVDLSKFAEVAADATVTPVVTSADGGLVPQPPVAAATGTASVTVPAHSVVTLVVDGVSGAAEDAATIRDGRDYRLIGAGSGRSLTAAADGGGAEIRGSSDDAAQTWRLTRVAEGAREFDNRTRYVVTTADGDRRLALRADRAVLEDVDGPADPAAQWIGSTTGDGTWTLVNADAGLLLEVSGEATHDGAEVSVWTPNSGAHQRWQVVDESEQAGP